MEFSRRDFGLGMVTLGAMSALSAGAAKAAAPKTRMLDTIVIGAGMAGLNTARLLEEQGQKVLVLEGRNRVGGRVCTLFDQPGYPEMGFNTMAEGYGRGLDVAKRAGVEMVDVSRRFRTGPEQLLYIGSQRLSREEWARSPLNPFPASMKSLMPWEIVGKLLTQNNPLKDWLSWWQPSNAALDISFHDYLAAQGLSDPAIRLAFDMLPYHGTNAWDVSAIMLEYNDGFLKSQALSTPTNPDKPLADGDLAGPVFSVKGGNQRLPEAMAKRLKGDVLLGKEVVAIDMGTSSATVTCADGSTYRAANVVSAIPFSVLRRIRITPGLTGLQAQAVTSINYQRVSIAFLTVREPFWEKDGLAANMWSDGFLGNVFAQRWGSTEHDITGLTVQARGEMSRYWDILGPERALQRVIAELEAVRPAAKGVVKGASYHSWSLEPFNAGAWAYYGPGQATTFPAEMSKPAGRLFFCGEHTARAARGLESALESSERVALEVLA